MTRPIMDEDDYDAATRRQCQQERIRAKRALLKVLDKEQDALVGRFLSDEEQLRLQSITEESIRLENEILEMGGEL